MTAVKPLGRRPGETAHPFGPEFMAYRDALLALPPANSNENARRHRQVLVRHNPALAPLFKALDLPI